MLKHFICLVSVALIGTLTYSQEIAIANGTVEGCGGFLLDTGIAFNDYSNNENFTMTLCAEDPETILNLYWNTFQLGSGDVMTIYDGSDTSAPLIGTFINNDLQTTNITSSINGCLTLVWVSDAEDTGNFSAEITCGLPCERPFVAVDIPETLPWRICVGEEISLDASPTTFADGTSLGTFTWDFGDNSTDIISWPTVTHSYSEPGAYIIQLFVTDDNECNSGNTIDVLVEVSTTPSFAGTSESQTICLGAEVDISGVVTPTEWSSSPSSNFGGALFIPDDQSQCFDSELLVTGFLADQTVTSETDLVNFFINFEHSYMGDLTITFLCPNGQSILAHSNSGGGTFLGEPVDDESQTPGVGYDYFWAPDATLGTWADEAGGGTLPAGTYTSENPFSDLIGCPLNGIWSVEICDNLGSDNGFIFDWSLTFDPSLYPEDLSFTPSIGADCDSTFWSSTDGPLTPLEDCNNFITSFTEEGEYEYTYHAIDNHGCEYTTDIIIEVSELTTTNNGDFTICPGQNLSVNNQVNFSNGVFTDMIYSWTPDNFLSSGTIENPVVTGPDTTVNYVFTAYPNGFEECATGSEITVTPIAGPEALASATDWCPNEASDLIAANPNLLDSINWINLNTNDVIFDSEFFSTDEPGEYLLLAYGCGIIDTDTVLVTETTCFIDIPNVFSPNTTDTLNSRFIIGGIQGRAAHLKVYSRWGNLVYENANYRNNWRPSRDEANDGTYFYVLTLSNTEEYAGTVTILR